MAWEVRGSFNGGPFPCIVNPEGDAEIGTYMIAERVRWPNHATLLAAAPELLEAVKLLEEAEDYNANCKECEGQGVPELCHKCFPLLDRARVARRLAIEKAERL